MSDRRQEHAPAPTPRRPDPREEPVAEPLVEGSSERRLAGRLRELRGDDDALAALLQALPVTERFRARVVLVRELGGAAARALSERAFGEGQALFPSMPVRALPRDPPAAVPGLEQQRYQAARARGLGELVTSLRSLEAERADAPTTDDLFAPVDARDAGASGRARLTPAASSALLQAADRRAATLFRRERPGAPSSDEPDASHPAVREALRRHPAGERLPEALQRELASRFPGVDLAAVRVHTDALAAAACEAVRARAFTVGEDLFFAEGAYDPGGGEGRALLVHELTHVAQFRQGRVPATSAGTGVSRRDDPLEEEARAAARQDAASPPTSGEARPRGAQPAPALGPAPAPSELVQRDDPAPGSPAARLGERRRTELAGVIQLLTPLGLVLRAIGLTVSGVCVGFRAAATEESGVGGSVGSDWMVFVDPIRWEITGDMVPYVEVGLGLRAGLSAGIVVALRLTPDSVAAGPARDAYEGGSISGSIHALAGIGLSVSTSLLQGQEGWAGAVFTLGAEAGGSFSYSYGLSTVNLATALGNQIADKIAAMTGVMRQLSAAGAAISDAIASAFRAVFAVFDPNAWDLTGYTEPERQAWMEFGRYMAAAIQRTTLDRFLGEESGTPPVPVSSRIGSIGDVGVFIRVSEAMNARARRRAAESGQPAPRDVWPANYFNSRTYIEFLRFALDNNLLSMRGSGGSPPPVGTQRQ